MKNDTALWPLEMVEYGNREAMIGEPVIIGGPEISSADLMAASDVIGRVVSLLASLPSRTGQTLYDTACWLGFSPAEAEALTEGCNVLDPKPYARADVIRTESGIRLVEINVGAVVGGAIEGSLPWLAGLDQPQNPMRAWIDYLGQVVPRHGRGVLVYDGPDGSEWNAHIQIMAGKIAQILDMDIVAKCRPQLSWDGTALCDEKGRFDWLYPVYFPWQVTANPAYYAPIRAAISNRAVEVPVHPSTLLLASKKMLVLLWQCAENGLLSKEEVELVKSAVPFTCSLSTETIAYALDHQQSLVLKPSNGHCGIGVMVGSEVTLDVWRHELERAIKDSDDDYLLQERCEPILEKAITIDPAGLREEYWGRYIWGMFVGNGEFCGTPFMRSRSQEGSLVINCANGAACGPLSMASSKC
ncbi:hypothetical protein [Pseudomonas fluorescens]|uniref:ATP-grasp domain-containing protein n=1 Tax=Pseudomonas fluorescens TaxID=294 RepID=A0A423LW30_PSEFL|nr:hypothetical protein [Pseudomonas fluorescens]RON72525.1 hypothetical protein BK671_01330 [Pseudomonas fluorescens]